MVCELGYENPRFRAGPLPDPASRDHMLAELMTRAPKQMISALVMHNNLLQKASRLWWCYFFLTAHQCLGYLAWFHPGNPMDISGYG